MCSMMENSNYGLIVIDGEFQNRWVDNLAEKIFSCPERVLVGKNFINFIVEEERQEFVDWLLAGDNQCGDYVLGNPCRSQFCGVNSVGTHLLLEICATKIKQCENERYIIRVADLGRRESQKDSEPIQCLS